MMSQLTTISNFKKSIAVCLFFLAFSFSNAQTCTSTLLSKNGTVLSARPGISKKVIKTNNVTIRLKKTGGKAETQVNIYIDNVIQPSKKMEFDNGNNLSPFVTRQLSGVRNKEVKVEIVNQSVANKFKYTLEFKGASSALSDVKTGNLIGQQSKTIITTPSCTGKTEIKIRRTGGKARGNIRIWKKSGSNWVAMNDLSETLEKNETNESIIVNSPKALKVELKNVSVGNQLGYRLSAVVK